MVKFSSVKKLMQMVKINKISYMPQPQLTAVVAPFQDFRRPTTLYRHGYDSSNDKTESSMGA